MGHGGKVDGQGGLSKRLVIVAGPTAAGKSALALGLARRLGGTVINADAMQCYRDLQVLTARPGPGETALAPHVLYGVRDAAEIANAAWWRGAALAAMDGAALPILCGGTGMYLSALLNGIAEVPDVGNAARAAARGLLAEIGSAGVHALLDAETAGRLKPGDSQRVGRAYEVLLGTGKGLAYWQGLPAEGLRGWDVRMVLLDPPRGELRGAIAGRFAGMIAAGAVEEVRALLGRGLPPALPLMRAHGVPELSAFLRGEISLAEAQARTVVATRQYTRRQGTWFRHQRLVDSSAMQTIHARIGDFEQLSESFFGLLCDFVAGGD